MKVSTPWLEQRDDAGVKLSTPLKTAEASHATSRYNEGAKKNERALW
jgi:hypothetical protein